MLKSNFLSLGSSSLDDFKLNLNNLYFFPFKIISSLPISLTICSLTLPDKGLIWDLDCNILEFHQFPITLSGPVSPLKDEPSLINKFLFSSKISSTNFLFLFCKVEDLKEINFSF